MEKSNFFNPACVILLVLLLLINNGCASSRSSLELDNIFDYKAELRQSIEAKKAEKAKKAAQDAELTKSEVRKDRKAREEILKTSTMDPPELVLLDIPEYFQKVPEDKLNESEIAKRTEKVFPGCTAVWMAKGSDFMIFAGKIPLDAERISKLSKNEFEKEIENLGAKYDGFYQSVYHSRANYNLVQEKQFYGLEITSKYLENGEWRTDLRKIYVYRPNYRLNIMLSGKDADNEGIWSDLRLMLEGFENDLSKTFPEELHMTEDVKSEVST